MKFNFKLIFKLISLILMIVAYFIPVAYYRFSLDSEFSYYYINDLNNASVNSFSLVSFIFLFIALVMLFGIMVDSFSRAFKSFQSPLKSINLVVLGSFLTLSLYLLSMALYDDSNWPENYYFVSPSLYLMILSAILFFVSFFFNIKSNSIKVDHQKKNSVLPYEQLAKLKKLFDDQVLTEEEYNQQKNILMEK